MRQQTKWLAVAALGIMNLSLAASSWAAFSSVETYTAPSAVVSFTAAGTVDISVQPKNISDNANATSIGFSAAPGDGWTMANQYLELTHTLTSSNGGIQIYTDNTDPAAAPNQATPPNASQGRYVVAGLINGSAPSAAPLPMAWAVKDTVTPISPTGFRANDPNASNLPPTGGGIYNGWFFFKDEANLEDPNVPGAQNMVPGEEYVTVNDIYGMHYGPGPGEYAGTPSPDFVYLESSFANAVTPATYGALIRVEAFTE